MIAGPLDEKDRYQQNLLAYSANREYSLDRYAGRESEGEALREADALILPSSGKLWHGGRRGSFRRTPVFLTDKVNLWRRLSSYG